LTVPYAGSVEILKMFVPCTCSNFTCNVCSDE